MKRMVIVGFILLMSAFFMNRTLAQSGPSWLIQGNLDGATKIWDFIEIPNTSIIIAGGLAGDNAAIWKSTNGGLTWTRKFYVWHSHWSQRGIAQFAYDGVKNIIFACSALNYSHLDWLSIHYSIDQGETWTSLVHPEILGQNAGAFSILLLNNKLYIAYQEDRPENGNNWNIYSAMLFRLDVSSVNPSDWVWEFLMQYPELDYIMRLAEKNGMLYVFGRDKASNAIRVFTYNTQVLDNMATRIGTVEEVRLQVEQYQAQLAQQEDKNSASDDHSSDQVVPVNEPAQR
ncbi:MAG: hypothetical protein D6748_16455 [Calditrichaeota bacterium]|nr:MAG: hypothetical protein D6748_16455 [Calditrichota bacterium]